MAWSLIKQIKGNGGYTLLEVILAMSLVSVLVMIPFRYGTEISHQMIERQFFNELHQDILKAQALAISTKQVVSVKLSRSNRYYALMAGTKELKRRPFPDTVDLSYKATMFEISFLSNGNVSQFGTILFVVSGKELNVKVHIGKGRVAYEFEGI